MSTVKNSLPKSKYSFSNKYRFSLIPTGLYGSPITKPRISPIFWSEIA